MKLSALLIASMAVTSCGTLNDAADKAKKKTGISPELVGEWQADCYEADILKISNAERYFKFGAAGDFEKKEYLYLEDNCEGDASVEYSIEGTYAVKGQNERNDKIENIDYTVKKAYIKVASETAVDFMNAAEVCGIDEWKFDERIEITDEDCGPFKMEKDTVIYDTYDINGDNLLLGGSLFLGNANDESSERPESVDQDIRHAKQ